MYLLFNSSARQQFLRKVHFKLSTNSVSILSCLRKSHYERLGVSRNATQSDIKAAYYKLSMVYHPDRNETAEAADEFREITEAYEVLGNFRLRKMYDKGLLGLQGTEDGSKREYTSYKTPSNQFKHKPTRHDRTNVYNFDEWSQYHYGDLLNKRQAAKIRYEQKVNPNSNQAGQSKNENVIYTVAILTILGFMARYQYSNSLDDPISEPVKKI